jgi:hypothetical protein
MKIRYHCFLIDKEKEWPWREWPLILYDENQQFDVARVEALDPLTLKIPVDKKPFVRYDFTFEEAKEIETYYKKENPELEVKIKKVYRSSF